MRTDDVLNFLHERYKKTGWCYITEIEVVNYPPTKDR
jgi:hypothetical protein